MLCCDEDEDGLGLGLELELELELSCGLQWRSEPLSSSIRCQLHIDVAELGVVGDENVDDDDADVGDLEARELEGELELELDTGVEAVQVEGALEIREVSRVGGMPSVSYRRV
jgi:hypothetical protein